MFCVKIESLNCYLARRPQTRSLVIYLGDFNNAILFDSVESARLFVNFYMQLMHKEYKFTILKVCVEVSVYE